MYYSITMKVNGEVVETRSSPVMIGIYWHGFRLVFKLCKMTSTANFDWRQQSDTIQAWKRGQLIAEFRIREHYPDPDMDTSFDTRGLYA